MHPTDRLSPHFTAAEMTIRNRVPGADLTALAGNPLALAAMGRLCAVLEVIRAEAGGAPIRVTSSYRHRDPLQHGAGQAADIQIDRMTPMQLLRLIHLRRAKMPHPLRQVIAETLAGAAADLDLQMTEGSGRWVHVAIMGAPGEKWQAPSATPWALSWDPPGDRERRVYRPWSPT